MQPGHTIDKARIQMSAKVEAKDLMPLDMSRALLANLEATGNRKRLGNVNLEYREGKIHP
jgi:hypothetical protein